MRTTLFYLLFPVIIYFSITNPLAGCFLYLGINVLRPEMIFWGADTGNILFKVIMFSTLVSFFVNKRSDFLTPVHCKYLWFILWMYVALLVSLFNAKFIPHPKAYDYALEILKLFVLGWLLVALITSEEKLFKIQHYLLVMFTILCLWGLQQKFLGNERIEGVSGFDSNELASMFVLYLPVALQIFINSTSKRTRNLALISALLLILGVIGTMSRTGFIGLLLIILLTLVCSKKKLLMTALVLIALLVGIFYVSSDYSNRINSITSDNRDYSAGSRLILWKTGLLVFEDNMFFGTGFLTFREAKLSYSRYFAFEDPDLVNYSFMPYKVGHNTYIQALSEGGLFLFIPYISLILSTLYCNAKCLYKHKTSIEHNNLITLLRGIQIGTIGCCCCFFFFDLITNIFLPVQILCAYAARSLIESNAKGPDL